MPTPLEVKFYYDYKSPFTYLAMSPGYALEQSHLVRLRFVPHELDVRGIFGGELETRPEISWRKVRYLYLDARRYANERGLIVRGPQKIFDSKLSLISGLFADAQGKFRPYSDRVFESFFKRELDIENSGALEKVLAEVGLNPSEFRSFAKNEGQDALARSFAEGEKDHVFGVPTIIIGGEPFWGIT